MCVFVRDSFKMCLSAFGVIAFFGLCVFFSVVDCFCCLLCARSIEGVFFVCCQFAAAFCFGVSEFWLRDQNVIFGGNFRG